MEPWIPSATCFRELLGELRTKPKLRSPILLEAVSGSVAGSASGSTMDQTVVEIGNTSWPIEPLQYARHGFRLLVPTSEDSAAVPDAKAPLVISFGRSRKCDVRVDEDSVSKHHATFTLDLARNRTLLVDEGSLNGSFVNDLQLAPKQEHLLRTGDRICFGQVMFVFMDPATLSLMAKDPIAIGFLADDPTTFSKTLAASSPPTRRCAGRRQSRGFSPRAVTSLVTCSHRGHSRARISPCRFRQPSRANQVVAGRAGDGISGKGRLGNAQPSHHGPDEYGSTRCPSATCSWFRALRITYTRPWRTIRGVVSARA